MSSDPIRTGGRVAAATRDDVIALAAGRFLDAKRVDVSELAETLGLARMTVYRWFGSRERLIGEMLARQAEILILAARAASAASGAQALLETFDSVNRTLAADRGLQAYLRSEGHAALRVLTTSDGVVQTRTVAQIERLIHAEIEGGGFRTGLAPATLAYAIVRLAEAFIYNDAAAEVAGDVERLREVQAALLGLL